MSWNPWNPPGWNPPGWNPGEGTPEDEGEGLQPGEHYRASIFSYGASFRAKFYTNGPSADGDMGTFYNLDASIDDEHNVAANF